MGKKFMDAVLSQSMFDIVFLCSAIPFGIEFMHFHCHIPQFLAVKAFIDLTESALSQKT
jgi:hypothetical protein